MSIPKCAILPAIMFLAHSSMNAAVIGSQSRAELIFDEQSIARRGANSVFPFSCGTRDLKLNRGAILMQVPNDACGTTIQTAASGSSPLCQATALTVLWAVTEGALLPTGRGSRPEKIS